MDQGSMDPYFGLGPWTTFVDRVHGPFVMDRVNGHFFKITRNEQKQKKSKNKIKTTTTTTTKQQTMLN